MLARQASRLGGGGGSGIFGFRGPAKGFAAAGLVSTGFGGYEIPYPRERLRSALAGVGSGFGAESGFGAGGSTGIVCAGGSLAAFLDRLLPGRGVAIEIGMTVGTGAAPPGGGGGGWLLEDATTVCALSFRMYSANWAMLITIC